MTEREKLLKEINDFYKNAYAQAVGGKMTELGMFSGEVKGLFKKKPYGGGFLLDDDGVIYKDFFSEKPSHFLGTECKENEYIKIYKKLGETKIYTSEKIILPNGCFVGSVNMMTSEHTGKYFDDDGTVYNGVFSARVFTKMIRSVSKENVISSENEKNIFTVSYANGDKYVGLLNGGLKNGKGELTLKSGEKISGIFENDKNPGAVKSTEPNAQNSNAQNANAKMSTQNASLQKQNKGANKINGKLAQNTNENYAVSMKFGENVYTGEIKNDLPNGYGEAVFANQDRYKGEWLDGKLNGKGTYIFSDGKKYIGEFVNNKKQGYGVFTWVNGDKYEGNFANDLINGKGTYTFSDGRVYVGELVNEKRQGQGTFTWPNGNKYVGEFANDVMSGQGTFTWANGGKYVGEFAEDKRNGKGAMTLESGNKYVGEFVNDKLQGHGTYTWADGDKYVGEFVSGKKQGHGTYTWANGNKYVGEYVNDKKQGKGIFTWYDGDEYIGEFANDMMNGKGTLTFANGIITKGEFKDDKKSGLCAIIDPVYNYLFYGYFKEGNLNGKAYIHDKFDRRYEAQCYDVEPGKILNSGINDTDGVVKGNYGLKKLWGKKIEELENELKKQIEILNKKSIERIEKEFEESDFNKTFLEEWNNHSK